MPQRRRQTATTLYGLPLLGLLALWQTVQALTWGVHDGFYDFTIFYTSSAEWLAGRDAYTGLAALQLQPNSNLPWFMVAMSPLAMLPYPIAAGVVLALDLVAGAIALRLVARHTGVPASTIAVVALASTPVALSIRHGQWAILLASVLTGAWAAARDDRPVRTGLLLGLLIAWKPFFGIFLPYVLWRRDWRTLGAAGGVLGLAGLAMLALWPETRSWLSTVGTHDHRANLSLLNLAHTVGGGRVLYVGLAASVAIVTAWRVAATTDRDAHWISLGFAAFLISPLADAYYPVVLIAPLTSRLQRDRGWPWLALAMFLVPWPLVAMIPETSTLPNLAGLWYTWAAAIAWLESVRPCATN